jgi:hypothetical protein
MLVNKASKQLSHKALTLTQAASTHFSGKFPNYKPLTLAGEVGKPKVAYLEDITKHRSKLALYDMEPRTENCWIAPNATLGKGGKIMVL